MNDKSKGFFTNKRKNQKHALTLDFLLYAPTMSGTIPKEFCTVIIIKKNKNANLFNTIKNTMQTFSETEGKQFEKYFFIAAEVAKQATCDRSKCGCVIVKNGEIIGQGFNSPAKNLESQRRCTYDKKSYDFKVTDKTCCIHAEQRAMFDALRHHPNEIIDSELFFIRLDSEGNMSKAGDPYCTICSKMALDLGVKYFYLRHEKGITCYDAQEYNTLSFDIIGKKCLLFYNISL